MEILITLCARGGSKGIPGKNIRLLNGKPLLAYSIEIARKFTEVHGGLIVLSTDNEEIKQVATSYGLISEYSRPAYLATDEAGKIDTIKDILLYYEKNAEKRFDFILDLDITSPLRNKEDLLNAFEIIQANQHALNLFSVNTASRNPYFNMVEQQENGYYGLVKKGNFLTRQSAPDVYELNASFYFYNRHFFDRVNQATISERSLIYIMPHICFDLDHPIDFEFMEFLLKENKLGFAL